MPDINQLLSQLTETIAQEATGSFNSLSSALAQSRQQMTALAARIEELDEKVTDLTEPLIQKRIREPLLKQFVFFYSRIVTLLEDPFEPVRANIRFIRDDMRNFLISEGVELIEPAPSSQFVPSEQRAVQTLDAPCPAANGKVSRCVRTGFKVNGRIVEFACVSVFRWDNTKKGKTK